MGVSRHVVLKITRIGKYSRTTVPKEVRKLLELREGDMIAWIVDGDRIIVEKAERRGG